MIKFLKWTLVRNSEIGIPASVINNESITEFLKIEKYKSFILNMKRVLSKNSSLTYSQINEVIVNQKLLRNFKLFLIVKDKNKSELRKKYGLNSYTSMRNHILYEDPSGKTKGCGCMYCAVRNREYREKLWYNSYLQEQKKLSSLKSATNKISKALIEKYGSDFDIEKYDEIIRPFDIKIFNEFGSVFRRQSKQIYTGPLQKDDNYSPYKRVSNITNIFTKQKDPITFYSVQSPSVIIDRISRIDKSINEKIPKREENYIKYKNFRKKLQLMF